MDEETMAVLAIQLLALSCIAAALVVYLVCKANRRRHTYGYEHSADEFPALDVGTGRSVLLTSCDTLFGIQLALHLTSLGFRVFAGIKPPSPSSSRSEAEAILRAKLKQREAASTAALLGAGAAVDRHPQDVVGASTFGTLVTVPLDVTREDSLHEAVEHVRRNLPAGEDASIAPYLLFIMTRSARCVNALTSGQTDDETKTIMELENFCHKQATPRHATPRRRKTFDFVVSASASSAE
ncbi:hypothetical protein V9T40_008245 [Parthenolecanium corni]|uniref:Uncharacterized protein n=1 Tax=Parthenolecanium corni TaxID=536013 RepID=A0AAN9TKI9_9HEMI